MSLIYESKYYGPTDTKGARIRVRRRRGANVKTTFESYDYAARDPHIAALDVAMVDDLGLADFQSMEWTECENVDGTGMVRIAWRKAETRSHNYFFSE